MHLLITNESSSETTIGIIHSTHSASSIAIYEQKYCKERKHGFSAKQCNLTCKFLKPLKQYLPSQIALFCKKDMDTKLCVLLFSSDVILKFLS